MGDDTRRRVDATCLPLNRYVDSLPAATVRNADQLLLFEAEGPVAANSSKHTVVLLADFKLNPKYQLLCRCTLLGVKGLYYDFPDDPSTATVSLAQGPGVVSSFFTVLDFVTSDTLALELASRCSVWKLYPLQWRFPELAVNLLDMVVTGRSPKFEVPKAQRKAARPCKAQATLDILNAPVASGLGGLEGGGSQVVEGLAVPKPNLFADVNIEGLDLDDLPPDLARDVLEEHLAQRFGVEVADVFAEEGGAIIHRTSSKRTLLQQRGGVYVLRMWIPADPPDPFCLAGQGPASK